MKQNISQELIHYMKIAIVFSIFVVKLKMFSSFFLYKPIFYPYFAYFSIQLIFVESMTHKINVVF